jgi:hypothetical protein
VGRGKCGCGCGCGVCVRSASVTRVCGRMVRVSKVEHSYDTFENFECVRC